MKKIYNVEKTFEGIRFDKWLRYNLGDLPQGFIEKNLRNGKFKINNKKKQSSYKLKLNDLIEVHNFKFINKPIKPLKKFIATSDTVKKNEKLIIDNNDNFIVINKKSGIPVQGGTKSKKNLIDIFSKSKFFNDNKPFSVHRLDKDTSGILIIAKNREYAQLFTSLFRLRKIYKTYLAVCVGELENNSGIWKSNLVRYEKNKPITEKAITKFNVLDKNLNCTLLKMEPITGRKHQLRKQLFEIGHPIIGDDKYIINKFNKKNSKILLLHSYKIKFIIKDKKYTYTALLPDYFKKFLKQKRINFSDF